MTGNVVVDGVEETGETLPRLPTGWVLGAGAAVVLVVVLYWAQPDIPATPTAVTLPEVVLDGHPWDRFDLPGVGGLLDVTRLVDGTYVAVGEGPQIWRYDGEGTWEWLIDGTTGWGTLSSVTPYADGSASWWSVAGAVAVGFEDLDGSTTRAAIWKSSDSRSWSRVPLDVGGPSALDGVVSAGRRLLAWGSTGSAADVAGDGRPLVLASTDGRDWVEIDAVSDGASRLLTITRRLDQWYAGGHAGGRPALWASSADLDSWESVDTGGLPVGWAIGEIGWKRLHSDDAVSLLVTLVQLGDGRARRWAHSGGTWRPIEERPEEVAILRPDTDTGAIGVGGGSLWTAGEGGWVPVELTGEVTAAAGKVAVGRSSEGRPRVWVEGGDGDEEIAIPPGPRRRWKRGRGAPRGGLRPDIASGRGAYGRRVIPSKGGGAAEPLQFLVGATLGA